MKANKAPEKLYLLPNGLISYCRNTDEDVEYTQTNAFIDKADKFISSFFHPDDTELKKSILNEFHKYMKGE